LELDHHVKRRQLLLGGSRGVQASRVIRHLRPLGGARLSVAAGYFA
jgi:hypothetical protein